MSRILVLLFNIRGSGIFPKQHVLIGIFHAFQTRMTVLHTYMKRQLKGVFCVYGSGPFFVFFSFLYEFFYAFVTPFSCTCSKIPPCTEDIGKGETNTYQINTRCYKSIVYETHVCLLFIFISRCMLLFLLLFCFIYSNFR